MPREVVVAEEASRDIDSIIDYLCRGLATPSAASDPLDAYDEFVGVIGAFPEAYPLCDDRYLAGLGYRKALLKNYVALYRVADDAVVIARVFHQSQDYARLI